MPPFSYGSCNWLYTGVMKNKNIRTETPSPAEVLDAKTCEATRLRETSPLLSRRAVFASLAALALTPVASVLTPVTPALAQSCLSASQTRNAIYSGEVISLSRVSSAVRARGYSEISSANICQSGGRYVYTVIASTASGASARITVDAATGSILSEQ